MFLPIITSKISVIKKNSFHFLNFCLASWDGEGRGRFSYLFSRSRHLAQPASTCSKLTIEILEQVVKYAQR